MPQHALAPINDPLVLAPATQVYSWLVVYFIKVIHNRSSGAHETMHSSGVLQLPSQRTLSDYTHYVEAASGFSADVDNMLMKAAKVDSCPDREKCVVMLLDEMHLREDLVFDKHTRAMIGFCDLGDITMLLLRYESEMTDEKPVDQTLTKSMMVFMIRGLFSSLQFPNAPFPCADISGDMLYEPFWQAVCRVEKCGLKVCLFCTYCCITIVMQAYFVAL